MHIVYKTTNIQNGKIYIGVHDGTKGWYLGSGKWLKRAIGKYGRESFVRETLQTYECAEDAFNDEQRWITKMRSNDPSVGYNISIGGFGNSPTDYARHKRMSEAHQRLYANGKKGYRVPPTQQERINASILGKKRAKENGQIFANGKYVTPKGADNPNVLVYVLEKDGVRHVVASGIREFCLQHDISCSSLYLNYKLGRISVRGKNVGWTVVEWAQPRELKNSLALPEGI